MSQIGYRLTEAMISFPKTQKSNRRRHNCDQFDVVLDKTLLDVLCCAESWRTTVPLLLVRFPNTPSDHRRKLEPRCILHDIRASVKIYPVRF